MLIETVALEKSVMKEFNSHGIRNIGSILRIVMERRRMSPLGED